MIRKENAIERALQDTADAMCLAAKTAPKACGKDSVEVVVLEQEEIRHLCVQMRRIAETEEGKRAIMARNAALLENCTAVVLIGSKRSCRALNCGYCGHSSCAQAIKAGAHCAYDDIDLGIAVGSAASVAANRRADNRVLYSAGYAAMTLHLMGEQVSSIIAIPLTADARNRFFVRGIS